MRDILDTLCRCRVVDKRRRTNNNRSFGQLVEPPDEQQRCGMTVPISTVQVNTSYASRKPPQTGLQKHTKTETKESVNSQIEEGPLLQRRGNELKKQRQKKSMKVCIRKNATIRPLATLLECGVRENNSRSLITLLALRRPSAWRRLRLRHCRICGCCYCRCARNARRTSSRGLGTGVRRDDGAFATFARRLRFFPIFFPILEAVVVGIFEFGSLTSALENWGVLWLSGGG